MMQATNDVIAAILPIGRLGVSGVALLIITIEAVSWLATDFCRARARLARPCLDILPERGLVTGALYNHV
jgi:hypothetical protein